MRTGVLTALTTVLLLAPTGAASANVSPTSGSPRTSFAVTFPAQSVSLDLQFSGPRGCRNLDELYIALRRARTGQFRFGPHVPGARPRRDGRRIRRWCRGRYRVDVVDGGAFEPSGSTVIATSRFTVR